MLVPTANKLPREINTYVTRFGHPQCDRNTRTSRGTGMKIVRLGITPVMSSWACDITLQSVSTLLGRSAVLPIGTTDIADM